MSDFPRDCYVDADRHILKQCATNLLSNAVKFTSQGSVTLRVLLQRDGDSGNAKKLTLAFIDTGRGLTQDELQQVMLPFAQLRTAEMVETIEDVLNVARRRPPPR